MGSSDAEKETFADEHPTYLPPELINILTKESNTYHFYVIELLQNFTFDVQVHGVVLAIRSKVESDIKFDLQAERGKITANFKYAGIGSLTKEQVLSFALCYFDNDMIKGIKSSCSS